MKSENSTQDLLDLLRSNEQFVRRLRELGDEQLLDNLAAQAESEQVRLNAFNPGTLQAALCITFNHDDMNGTPEQIEVVLNEASVQISNGQSRLRLSDRFRGKVLLDAQQHGKLEPALRMTEEQDRLVLSQPASNEIDLESAWLRSLLRPESVDLERFSQAQISAAYRSRLALCECEALLKSQPSLTAIRRQMQWLELLEPMRLMIGAPQRRPAIVLEKDRFAGREKELRELRSFVDELDSQSAMESLGRFVSRTGRMFSNKPRLMMISARGGLGKSTLISKFAYDHAVGRTMPLAYLDFDSAVLQPQNPLLLLAEVIRQVSLFCNSDEYLENFSQELHKAVRRSSEEQLVIQSEGIGPGDNAAYFMGFRAWLRTFIADRKTKAFLLILDTLELVQSNPQAIDGIQQFIRGLTDDEFPELVVVASGRAEVPELWDHDERNWNFSAMELEPFNHNDARRMVQRLGEQLLPKHWQPGWSRKMIGDAHGSAAREPLSLRIAVEAVRNAEPGKRDVLIDEIASMGEDCDPESVDFVGRLYQKRILEHIGDPYARQLAWPGLVARSISRDLARYVLAPECGLSAEQADIAFERLRREVWIVTEEGGALRHRPDLRARTMPLMRRHNAALFNRICAVMSAHHLDKQPAETLEATYYQLLADDRDATRLLDADSSGRLWQLLLTRQEDFTNNSIVAQELSVRQASDLLPWPEFQALSKHLAWSHFEQSGKALKAMDDRRVDPRVVMLSRTIEASSGHKINAGEQSILIKTGRWAEVSRLEFVKPQGPEDLRAVVFLGNFLSSVSWMDSRWNIGYSEFLASVNPAELDWLTLVYMLLPSHRLSTELYQRIDAQLAEYMPRKGLIRHRWMPALRVALAFSTQSLRATVHLLSRYRNERAPMERLFSDSELEILQVSPVLEGHRIKSKGGLLGGLRAGKDIDREADNAAIKVLEIAVIALENRRPYANHAREDVRRFALAGFVNLAGPAGYLLSLSKQAPRELLKNMPKLKAQKTPRDFIQLCRNAEQERELNSLLYGVPDEVNDPLLRDNLELLEILSESWRLGLKEHFSRGRLP